MDIGFEGFRYSWGKNRYAIKSIDCAAVFCHWSGRKYESCGEA